MVTSVWESNLTMSFKIKNSLSYNSAVPSLGIEGKNVVPKDIKSGILIATLFVTTENKSQKEKKNLLCSATGDWGISDSSYKGVE